MTLLSVRPKHRAPETAATDEATPVVRADATDVRDAAPRGADRSTRRRTLLLVLVLGVLSALGPLATDLYLPALPQISADLGASESSVKLTLTSVMAGLALGQLVIGPLSDRWGRRLPLLAGIGVFTATTLAIAMVSSVEAFSALRFLQGLSAAAGLVVSRAIVRDVFDGDAAATFFSRLV
ncbi:MFS transporter, partial [Nocardiopsis tropica]|nr:MFS transporter [Nocardiopsis tropica]